MATLRITQVKSSIGGTHTQRETLRSLGLRKISSTTEREDTPQVVGMIRTVAHLISVEEVSSDEVASAGPSSASSGRSTA